MKSHYYNYFADERLYQWDKEMSYFIISITDIKQDFGLDKAGMDLLIRFMENNALPPKIKVVGNTLNVSCIGKECNIKTIETDLPNFFDINYFGAFKIDISKLKTAIKFTTDDRPLFSGVYVNNNNIYATNQYFAYRTPCENKANIIIPKAFINLIDATGELEFEYNANVISTTVNNATYVGRLISGNYPNIEPIFQRDTNLETTLYKDTLKNVFSYSLDNKNDKIIFSNKLLNIIGDTIDIKFDLPVECEEKICFSLEMLKTIVSCVKEDTLTFRYKDSVARVFVNDEFVILPIKMV